MKLQQLAVQLYTVRDFIRQSADLAATLRKIREIGFPAVEGASIAGIPEAEIVRLLDGEGLHLCSMHDSPPAILAEPERVLDRARALRCDHVAYSYPVGIDLADAAQVVRLCEGLERAGALFRQAGVTLAYHHHAIEFARFGTTTVLDTILERTARRHLFAQLDTYWVQCGGGDPVAWCAKVAGRLAVMHLKDYGYSVENKPVIAEIGRGNLDFRRIIAAAENSGCRWFVVEQDFCPGDPFDSLRLSFEYIRQHLLES